jgi:hypothetical protein
MAVNSCGIGWVRSGNLLGVYVLFMVEGKDLTGDRAKPRKYIQSLCLDMTHPT